MSTIPTETGIPACAALCAAIDAKRGVNRRIFLSAATIAAVTTLLEACGGGEVTGPTGTEGTPIPPATGGALIVTLASFPTLASVGGIARVDGGSGSPTALVRTGASTFVALSMICTHAGTTVNISGSGFLCPNHGAQYASDGSWVGGQRTTSLSVFTSNFNASAGTVTISRP